MLELKDASLTVGGRRLLSGFSMIAMDGQLTCVTGAAGSGKTLLARVMLGFQPLDAGFISLDGALLTPLSAPYLRRLMAYVPQQRPAAAEQWQPRERQLRGLDEVWWPADEPPAAAVPPVDVSPELPPLASRRVVIADDPAPELLGVLKALAGEGRTVAVMSCREEYKSISDKLITLDTNDHHLF